MAKKKRRKPRLRAAAEAQRAAAKTPRPLRRRVPQSPTPVVMEHCQFPDLFAGEGCCRCGALDELCKCAAIDRVAHFEQSHRGRDSRAVRDTAGCPLSGSEAVVPAPPGHMQTGFFEAPCGGDIGYMTDLNLPTMAHYRWHAIYDHLARGVCDAPRQCRSALETGRV